jgi:uncharacterized membrane protein YccF (DUF307 family)
MPPVSILLNILWILLGGAWMAAGWVIAAVIMAITIIGIPWARAAFNIAALYLAAVRPEGRQPRHGHGPIGHRHRAARVIGNLIWLVLAGWWLALAHVITAMLLAVTIIGIPFAWAHLKLAASRCGRSAR